MENLDRNGREQGNQQSQDFSTDLGSPANSGPNSWNDQTQVVNAQDQNQGVNTGDPEYKENVTGRTDEPTPRDLNLSGVSNVSEESTGGAEIETPHKIEGDDEISTEKKIPKM